MYSMYLRVPRYVFQTREVRMALESSQFGNIYFLSWSGFLKACELFVRFGVDDLFSTPGMCQYTWADSSQNTYPGGWAVLVKVSRPHQPYDTHPLRAHYVLYEP